MNTPELNAMYTQGMQPPGQQQVPAEQPQQFAAAPHQMPQQIPQMQQVFPGPQPNDQQHGQQIPPQQDRQFAVPQQDQQGFAQSHLQPHENPLAQHPPNMQFGGVPQMPQMGQGGAQPQPFDQQFGQQIPLQPTPQQVAVPQHVPQMQHAGFVPQPQQAQFGTPAAHGVDEGYFQQGQQQQQQLQPGMPMGVQDLALGGQAAAGGPQGAFPGDAAWGHANVSQVNPPGPGGDYGREARRQERQRAQEIREAELSQMDRQLQAMRVQEDRELQAVLALSLEEDEEQLEEQFRRDTHAQTIASRQHQIQDYERRREQFRQSHGLGQGGGDYRVNMVRNLDVYVPDHERVVVTSLLDLQERFRSPVSLSGSLGFGEGSVESAGVVSQGASNFGSPALSMMREGACTLRDHTIQLEGSAPTDRDGLRQEVRESHMIGGRGPRKASGADI